MADSLYLNRVLNVVFDGADESTDLSATDKSAYAHTLASVSGANLETTSPISGTASLDLDGVNDCAVISGGSELFRLKKSAFCIEFDYKWSGSPSADMGFIGQWDTASGLYGWRIYYDHSDNSVVFAYSSTGFGTTDEVKFDMDTDDSGNTDIFDGSVHHIAAYRRPGGTFYIAVDGIVAANTDAYEGTIETNISQDLDIGCGRTSGARDNFLSGMIDNIRITMGNSVYTATSGTFTPDTRPFDLVDAEESASYAYPLTLNLYNDDASEYSHFPWLTEYGSEDGGMSPMSSGVGGPTPDSGSYCFVPGAASSVTGGPTNATAGVYTADIDLSRYDSQFTDDVDDGLLELNASVKCYIETAGDGMFFLGAEFYSAGDTLLGIYQADGFVPSSAATWETLSLTSLIPPSTRTIRLVAGGKKESNVYADTRYFMDTFSVDIDEVGYTGSDQHVTAYFADATSMIANWDGGAGTMTGDNNTSTANSWFREVTFSSTGLGTDVDSESPIINLVNETDDIDNGDVDYNLTAFMANNSDSCALWIEFYESDGTTQVGSRVSSTQETRSGHGETVTMTGTIPVGAVKAKVGVITDNGASSSRFNMRDVWLQEVGPNGDSGGAGASGGFHIIRRRRRYRTL